MHVRKNDRGKESYIGDNIVVFSKAVTNFGYFNQSILFFCPKSLQFEATEELYLKYILKKLLLSVMMDLNRPKMLSSLFAKL